MTQLYALTATINSLQTTQNETLSEVIDRVQTVEEQVGTLIDGINVKIMDVKNNLLEVHVKVLKSIDIKVAAMKMELMDKMDEKIEKLENKMDKVLKALNIDGM